MTKRRPLGNTMRFEILKRDNFRCVYCGATSADGKLQVDHIVPVSKGGSDSPENLVTSCFSCNIGKRDKLLDKSYLKITEEDAGSVYISPIVIPNNALKNVYNYKRKSDIVVLGAMYKALMDRAVEDDFSLDDPNEFRRLTNSYLIKYYKSPSRVTEKAGSIRQEKDLKFFITRQASLLSKGYTLIDPDAFFDNRLSRQSLILLMKMSEMRGFGRINLSVDAWKSLMGVSINEQTSKFIDRAILKPLDTLVDVAPNLSIREVQRISRRGSRRITSISLTYSYPAVRWSHDVKKIASIINKFKEEY